MEKRDERRRVEHLDKSRELGRNPTPSPAPLVPDKIDQEKYQRNADITATGQTIVEVLASEKQLMDTQAWPAMRLPEKRALLNRINRRVAQQTGQPPLHGEIGDTGSVNSYLSLAQQQPTAKISLRASKSPTEFGCEIARLHVFHYQEQKLQDPVYADSREGQEVAKVLSVGGNSRDHRKYTVTVQTTLVGGDAERAIASGKLIKAPAVPDKTPEKLENTKVTPQKSMDDRRLDTINILFSDARITDKTRWDSMKRKSSEKWQLFVDLNGKIARSQEREPLPAILGDRKTALYGDKGHRVAHIQYCDTEDRLNFITAIGQLNLRQFQELGREEPQKYSEIVTNAKIKQLKEDGEYVIHDLGMINYHETQWNKVSRERSGTNRIDIHTLETLLLAHEIKRAYGELTQIEADRQRQKIQELEKARQNAQSS